jgi:hypothetical protein
MTLDDPATPRRGWNLVCSRPLTEQQRERINELAWLEGKADAKPGKPKRTRKRKEKGE